MTTAGWQQLETESASGWVGGFGRTKQTPLLGMESNVLSAYIALHLHTTPCFTAVFFMFFFAWARPPSALHVGGGVCISDHGTQQASVGAVSLFDSTTGAGGRPLCRVPKRLNLKPACPARFAQLVSPSCLCDKTGRSPGCAAVRRNQTNHPGCAASADGETMIWVRPTAPAKESQRGPGSDVDL